MQKYIWRASPRLIWRMVEMSISKKIRYIEMLPLLIVSKILKRAKKHFKAACFYFKTAVLKYFLAPFNIFVTMSKGYIYISNVLFNWQPALGVWSRSRSRGRPESRQRARSRSRGLSRPNCLDSDSETFCFNLWYSLPMQGELGYTFWK